MFLVKENPNRVPLISISAQATSCLVFCFGMYLVASDQEFGGIQGNLNRQVSPATGTSTTNIEPRGDISSSKSLWFLSENCRKPQCEANYAFTGVMGPDNRKITEQSLPVTRAGESEAGSVSHYC